MRTNNRRYRNSRSGSITHRNFFEPDYSDAYYGGDIYQTNNYGTTRGSDYVSPSFGARQIQRGRGWDEDRGYESRERYRDADDRNVFERAGDRIRRTWNRWTDGDREDARQYERAGLDREEDRALFERAGNRMRGTRKRWTDDDRGYDEDYPRNLEDSRWAQGSSGGYGDFDEGWEHDRYGSRRGDRLSEQGRFGGQGYNDSNYNENSRRQHTGNLGRRTRSRRGTYAW